MKTICGLLVLSLGVLHVPIVTGEPLSGTAAAALLKTCRAQSELVQGAPLTEIRLLEGEMCLSYLEGMLDMHTLAITDRGLAPLFCLPEGGSVADLIRVVVRYVATAPERDTATKPRLLVAALAQAFPCPAATTPPKRPK